MNAIYFSNEAGTSFYSVNTERITEVRVVRADNQVEVCAQNHEYNDELFQSIDRENIPVTPAQYMDHVRNFFKEISQLI